MTSGWPIVGLCANLDPMQLIVDSHLHNRTSLKVNINRFCVSVMDIPSGKHTKNYGKSPFLMGKSTINGHFQ
jgi:hypothetical protein